jgi:uncharacterized protein (DUF849 family)
MLDRYQPIALTAAITGGDVLPSQSPHIPRGVDQIVKEAVAAANAGATSIHLHARDADGRPTAAANVFAAITAGIREQCEVVLNITTGGSPNMSDDERIQGVVAGAPEIATLNLGSMNYVGFPNRERWPAVKTDWERALLDEADSTVFKNTLRSIRHFAAVLKQHRITPELEVYDVGHIGMARFLIDEGTLEPPIRMQLVLGVLGGAGNSLDELVLMRRAAEHLLGHDLGRLGVAATGFPTQFRHVAVAMAWGMDCRVGMEDNLRIERDRQATSNAEHVERAIAISKLVARPVMTPDELRSSLGPWSKPREAATAQATS